uniref:DnaJ homolog subfamily C member 10 n=1 Tax=Macrostomum lignano TaxID=282301 RepID=A0A1I8FTP2_9PLAT
MHTLKLLIRPCLLLSLLLLLLLCTSTLAASGSEDYYTLLGVSRTATAAQIKKAFKKLVMEKHPDRNKADPGANALFMRINRAYEVLKSPELRERYDRFGEAGIKAHEEEGQQYERAHGAEKAGGLFADDPQIVKLTPERYESVSRNIGEGGDGQIWFVNFYASQVTRSEKFAQMGHRMYTGPLTKESLLDAALRRIEQSHVELTESNVLSRLSDQSAPAHWLVTFCGGRGAVDCFSQRTLKKLAFVFHGYVGVGRVDCASRRRPVYARASARLFVNANSGGVDLDALGAAGLPVTSLHTQETVRGVLRLLPPLPAGGSLRQAHLLLLDEASSSTSSNADAQLKRLEPLLKPHKIRVARLACGNSADQSTRNLCQRLPILRSAKKQQHQPAAVLIKRTGDFEVYYGEVHYMDIKEFALAAIANPMTGLTGETFCQSVVPALHEGSAAVPRSGPPLRIRTGRRPASRVRLRFGAIDCTIDKALCNRFSINSYPTLLLLLKGNSKRVKFRGSKFAHQMLAFAEAFVKPAAVYFNPDSFENTVAVSKRTHVWLVYFHSVNCQPCVEFMPELNALAKNFQGHRHIRIGAVDCVTHPNLCSRNGIRSYPTIRAYPVDKTGPDDYFDYNSPFRNSDSIASWLETFSPQSILMFNSRSLFQSELASDEPWVVYFYADWCGPCQAFAPTFKAVANKLGRYANFGKVDCDPYQDLCVSKGIQAMPSVALFTNGKLLQHLSGQSVYNLESSVKTHYSKKRDKARVFYGYHSNQFDDDEGGGGGGWQRVVINDGSGQFFTMGDGMPFQFVHDEF